MKRARYLGADVIALSARAVARGGCPLPARRSDLRDAFGPSNTAADIDNYCGSAYTPAQQSRELADPSIDTLVVERDGALVAIAQLQATPPPPEIQARAPIELRRFYVLERCHGTGLAQQLMQSVFERATARGDDLIFLAVWEHNPRALRFYAKCGLAEFGARTFMLGTSAQRDVMMSRRIE